LYDDFSLLHQNSHGSFAIGWRPRRRSSKGIWFNRIHWTQTTWLDQCQRLQSRQYASIQFIRCIILL
jgi:hypothetical protein